MASQRAPRNPSPRNRHSGGPSGRRSRGDRSPRVASFPDPSLAGPEGLLAAGGDLSPESLLTAYSLGIFPWYSEGETILWWSPDPRLVLELDRFHVSRSLQKSIRRKRYEVRADTAFAEVIERCARKERPGQGGTWITPEMKEAYIEMHRLGFAHSVESLEQGRLVGGLYGMSLGGVFYGESMFTDRPDASKVAFACLIGNLAAWGFDFIDCQVRTEHLLRWGAREIPRSEFLRRLSLSMTKPTRAGPWNLDPSPSTSP
ncbi:MAG: leucyl/phenylalanyl-tRNA--protein transferase [Vicinamibacteria bacterium]